MGDLLPKINLFENDLFRIEQMNALGLEYAVLSSTGDDAAFGLGDSKRQLLFFADVSIQAFLAAYWAVNWTNDVSDVLSVSHWIPNPISTENSVYLEFWQMILEMPQRAVDTSRFHAMLSPLYDRSLQPAPTCPIRSTELLYRSWDRMIGTSAQAAFQREFADLVAAGNPVARGLLFTEEGCSAFVQLADHDNPRDTWDTGEFMMGAVKGEAPGYDGFGPDQNNVLHEVRLSPFRFHRFCVSNAEYEIFDSWHRQWRAFSDRADVTTHPAVNISWFDAWCFARWINVVELEIQGHPRSHMVVLPTESQWE
jgi:hypothetical protein